MFHLSGNVKVYRTHHKVSDVQIVLDIIVPKTIVTAQNSIIDMSEELAKSSHQTRRLFLEKLHELYSTTRCVHKIQSELKTNEYFSYITGQGYKLLNILLAFDPAVKTYKYCLCLTK